MHHNPRRLLPSTIIATAALTAAVAVMPAPASAQVPGAKVASATSSESEGMKYLGGSLDNDVRITLSGATFTVDDIVPIQAGAGCTPVAGDATKVTCVAFRVGTGPNAKFMRFFVNTGAGNNTLINQTNSGAQGAPMLALGNSGNDTLIGGDGVHDELRGSSGNDTLRSGNESPAALGDVLEGGFGDDKLFGGDGSEIMDGGPGADTLDGGDDNDSLDGGTGKDIIDGGVATSSASSTDDTVVYDRGTAVQVDLRRTDASQGTPAQNGAPGENDTILRVENVRGSNGDDKLTGNLDNNILIGGPGDDELRGQEGFDRLFGLNGADVLIPSPAVGAFGLPTADGEADIMDCSDDPGNPEVIDDAFRVLSDDDFVDRDCERVIDIP